MTAYTLNLLDLAFTLHALHNGGVELNPLMRCVPVLVGYKLLVVGVFCLVLRRLSRAGYLAVTAVYGAVILYHIYFIFWR